MMNKYTQNYFKVMKRVNSIKKITPNKNKRKLGILKGKAQIIFRTDFKMTEEEFLSL